MAYIGDFGAWVNTRTDQAIDGVKTFLKNTIFNGNIGVGVTPSAWKTTWNALQVGENGSLSGRSDAVSAIKLSSNWYENALSQDIYIQSLASAQYTQVNGSHTWLTAPSGTAGNTITWTTGLTVPLGGGIQLPNTAIASATTLDWYEEGTFTPTIVGSTTAGVGTYTQQVGKYTRVGNRIDVSVYLVWTAHTGTGQMRLSGLPFAINGVQGSIIAGYDLTITGQLFVQFTNGLQYGFLYALNNGAASPLNIDTSATIVCNFTYFV